MIVIFGVLAGGILGARSARARNGDRKDIAQYAAVWAILGALIGLFATIAIERML